MLLEDNDVKGFLPVIPEVEFRILHKCNDMFGRFDTAHTCDRQTDGQIAHAIIRNASQRRSGIHCSVARRSENPRRNCCVSAASS